MNYDILLRLPIFLGVSRNDMVQIVGQTKFLFRKFSAGQTIIHAESPCQGLTFITHGSVEVSSGPSSRRWTLTETMLSPQPIEQERFFGLKQHYQRTYRAIDECSGISLTKSEVMRLTYNYEVCAFNLINSYATQVQRLQENLMRTPATNLREFILRFVEDRSVSHIWPKTLHIKMEQLGAEINASRYEVSRELRKMQADGLISMSRAEIRFLKEPPLHT